MPERMAQLSEAGKLFASWLYTIELPTKIGNQSYEDYAEGLRQMGFDPPVVLKGIVDDLAARVVLRIEDSLFLAPDFSLLGDKWFSLLTVARIFIDNEEYERARERLREAFTRSTPRDLSAKPPPSCFYGVKSSWQ